MTLHQRLNDTLRSAHSRVCVAVGACLGAGPTMVLAAWLWGGGGAALAALGVLAGAGAAAALVAALLALRAECRRAAASLVEISARMEAVRAAIEARPAAHADPPGTRTINLANFGDGDPSKLAAARLDRDVFPRLVGLMDDEALPSARSPSKRNHNEAAGEAGSKPPVSAGIEPDGFEAAESTEALRDWNVALRRGDLSACRAIYRAVSKTLDPADLEPFTVQLSQLVDRAERSLRAAFADRRRERDVHGMLEIGEHICALLPDRPVAEEFRRVEASLRRQAARQHGTDEAERRVQP